MAITDSRPRQWLQHEIDLYVEVAHRVFPRLERADAEEALRQSEEKDRTLYSMIDEGFCIFEMQRPGYADKVAACRAGVDGQSPGGHLPKAKILT